MIKTSLTVKKTIYVNYSVLDIVRRLFLLEQEPSHRREYTVTNEEETISKLIRENERDILLEYLHYTFY